MSATSIAKLFERFFYTFLDIMGILLGVFLTALGCWIVAGRSVSVVFGALVLFCGVAAFFIHTGHYFHLRLTRWIFGSGTYFHKDQKD
jgi:hypothetical protein